jgi:hypothetical protein
MHNPTIKEVMFTAELTERGQIAETSEYIAASLHSSVFVLNHSLGAIVFLIEKLKTKLNSVASVC